MSTFSKPASGTDQYFVAINELRPPFVVQLVLEGDGDPTPESLDDALQSAAAVNPGCSLVLDESTKPVRWVTGPGPTLTLVDAPELTGDSDSQGPFFMWPLDAKVGPTCELLFVRGKTKRYLIFRALHAVMDGQGTLLWAKDVMRCLRGEDPVGHSSALSVDDLIRSIGSERRPAAEQDAIHTCAPATIFSEQAFHWQRVSAERPLDGKAAGRIAVALASLAHARTHGIVRINLPTDLRSYRPEVSTTGNLFGCLSLEIPQGATADGIALKIIQQLYKKEGAKPVGLYSIDDANSSMALLRAKTYWDLHHLHDTGRYLFSATLSHLGALDGLELSAPSFAAHSAFFVPLVGDVGCSVCLNGFGDRTYATVGLSDRFCHDGQLEALAAAVRLAIGG